MNSKLKLYQVAILALLFSFSSIAQVGIGNTSPNATLDISASNQSTPSNTDGILIPRIDALPATNPGSNQNSMIVYLTTTDGSLAPGFYFWEQSSTSWQTIGGNDWSLNGNTGTVNGTSFIGTTDNQAIDIRTNNILRARVTNNGQIEILNTGQSVFLGEGAGAVHNNSATRRNVFIGYEAGHDVTTGFNNTAIGWGAFDKNVDGVRNTVIGAGALDRDTDPDDNIAIGSGALGSANGDTEFTVAIGNNALSNASDAVRNTAIGQAAGSNVDGPDNVFIGANTDTFNTDAGATRNVIIGAMAGESGISGTAGGTAYEGRVFIG